MLLAQPISDPLERTFCFSISIALLLLLPHPGKNAGRQLGLRVILQQLVQLLQLCFGSFAGQFPGKQLP